MHITNDIYQELLEFEERYYLFKIKLIYQRQNSFNSFWIFDSKNQNSNKYLINFISYLTNSFIFKLNISVFFLIKYYHNGSEKYDVIQKLIDLYALLIEHYDNIQDPVGYYFNEKLQSLFACQRALKSIRKTNQDQIPSIPTHSQSLIVQETNNNQNSQESAKSKQTVCVEHKKRERQTKAKIAMEIQDKIQCSQNDLQHLISGYQKASDQTQKAIEEDLKRQDDLFMQRKLKRESIIPY